MSVCSWELQSTAGGNNFKCTTQNTHRRCVLQFYNLLSTAQNYNLLKDNWWQESDLMSLLELFNNVSLQRNLKEMFKL